jgi:hypothetical protein
VLVNGNFVLRDSNAIITYLATTHHTPSLLSSDHSDLSPVWHSAEGANWGAGGAPTFPMSRCLYIDGSDDQDVDGGENGSPAQVSFSRRS